MRIAVHTRKTEPFSFAGYRDNIIAQLLKRGFTFVPFSDVSEIADVDLIWEPGIGGSRVPRLDMLDLNIPVVVTCHGASPFVLPIRENWHSLKSVIREQLMMWIDKFVWLRLKKKVSGIIAVSEFGADEITRVFRLPTGLVKTIHHGVNKDIFCPEEAVADYKRPYFLLVAQYQPIKNIDRIFQAYNLLECECKPDLVAIIPGYNKNAGPNIFIVREKVSPEKLATWYRGAVAFVFPSLRESFGLPIIEAMSCGCPVITSNNSACREVTGDAALLVDPYNCRDIKEAMRRIYADQNLRQDLKLRAMEQAKKFSWERSATLHADVFNAAVGSGDEGQ